MLASQHRRDVCSDESQVGVNRQNSPTQSQAGIDGGVGSKTNLRGKFESTGSAGTEFAVSYISGKALSAGRDTATHSSRATETFNRAPVTALQSLTSRRTLSRATVSELVDDSSGRPDEDQANKIPKTQ